MTHLDLYNVMTYTGHPHSAGKCLVTKLCLEIFRHLMILQDNASVDSFLVLVDLISCKGDHL